MNLNIGEKWKRLSRELFDFFESEIKASGSDASEKFSPWYALKIQELYKCGLNNGDIREVISFAVKNWDQIRDMDSDGKRLDPKPNLLQIFGPWRFAKYLKLAREGFSATNMMHNEGIWKSWTEKEK